MSQTIVPTSSLSVKRWKCYSSYKDSGVEWLGGIPKHWEVKKLKYVVAINADTLPEDTKPDYVLKYVDISSVDSNGKIHNSEEMIFKNAPSRARRRAWQDDTIISTVRTYLRAIAIIEDSSENLIVSTGFAVLRSLPGVHTRFLWRLVQSEKFVEKVVTRSEGVGYPAINPGTLASLPVWLPPISEQRAIATFLDHHTTRINALIAKKEQLIELLKEKRAALISQAVTKGLDPAVPMKDSGVKWLSSIPTHWEVKRMRDIAESLQTGPFGSQLHSGDYISGCIPVINPSHLKKGCIIPDWECTVDEQTRSRLIHHELREGDIVIARRGEMGRCALVTTKETGWLCGTGSLRVRPRRDKYNPSFLNMVLSVSGIRDWLLLECVGSTMDNLNTKILSVIPLPVPPLSEQQFIVTYLDQETAGIDALISRIQDGIKKLKEYSTALISAAVTGKIDIRDVAEESQYGYLGEEP